MKHTLRFCCLTGLFLISGCAATTLPEARTFTTIETVEPQEPFKSSDMFIASQGDWRYEIDAGDAGNGTIVLRRAHDEEYDAMFSDNENDRRIQYWVVDKDGALLLAAVVEHDEQAVSIFDPPLMIAPAQLAAGESRTAESKMRVVDSKNPRHQRERGTGVSTIEYVGDERVDTPLGDLVAKRLKTRFEAKLGLATAVHENTIWVVPDIGVIAEESTQQITALGLFNKSSNRRIVLIEAPAIQ